MVGQPTGNKNTNEQGEDRGIAVALSDEDYTSATDEERDSDTRHDGTGCR